MLYLLIFLNIINLYFCIPCIVICQTTPCFTTVLTTTTYNFYVINEKECDFEIKLSTNTILETLHLNFSKVLKSISNPKKYILNTNNVRIKEGEKYCSLNSIIGNSNMECIGDISNVNFTNKILTQNFNLEDFINNNNHSPDIDKKLNMSINQDLNREFEIVYVLLDQITSDKNNNPESGTKIIPNSFGSTYTLSGSIQQINNLMTINEKIGYNFNNFTNEEQCFIQEIPINELINEYSVNCDNCLISSTNYKIKNVPLLDNKICRDLERTSFGFVNHSMVLSFIFTMENNLLLSTSIYKPERTILKKITFELHSYLNSCLIKPILPEDDLQLISCDILSKITNDIIVAEKVFNTFIKIYKEYTLYIGTCERVIIDCHSTKVEYKLFPKMTIEKNINVPITQGKQIESKIGWWLLFLLPKSLLYWIRLILDYIIMGLPHLILTIGCYFYTKYQINKLHKHLDKIESYERL